MTTIDFMYSLGEGRRCSALSGVKPDKNIGGVTLLPLERYKELPINLQSTPVWDPTPSLLVVSG